MFCVWLYEVEACGVVVGVGSKRFDVLEPPRTSA